MTFEWDEIKDAQNTAKHGMSFVDAVEIFDGRDVYTYLSPRNEEQRLATIGMIEDRLWVVVWTPREENIRIISAHRADDGEERKYRSLFG
jgi:uncharacterized DUF497 family protein